MADLSSIIKEDYVEGCEKYYFDTIPMWKLIFLLIVTLGFYNLVWTYNLWKRLSVNFGYNISPFWRTVFGTITNIRLFPILEKYIKAFNLPSFPGILFAIFVMVNVVISRSPEPYCWISELLLIVPIIIQIKLNRVNERIFPNAEVNGWNLENTVWSIPFVLLWVLFILATIFPE